MSVDAILSAIEAEHERRCKAAHAVYEDEIAPARRAFEAARQLAADRERGALEDAKKWRAGMIKAARPGKPFTILDIKSVQRKTISGAHVSLAHVEALEGRP